MVANPPYTVQIEAASQLFASNPSLGSCILLHPPAGETFDPGHLRGLGTELASFNVIGVTDGEVGTTTRERVSNISLLRQLLDEEGCGSPIHIFGALDPLVVTLYFMAGAELFDGLTWVRHASRNGISTYGPSASLDEGMIDELDIERITRQRIEYIHDLESHRRLLLEWLQTGDITDLPFEPSTRDSLAATYNQIAGSAYGG